MKVGANSAIGGAGTYLHWRHAPDIASKLLMRGVPRHQAQHAHVDSRQSPPRHAATSYDRPVASGRRSSGCGRRRTAARAILSYSLKVDAGRAFRELAAGSARQLARALRVSGEDQRIRRSTVDLVADMAVINPFDFFVEPYAETFPFAYPRRRSTTSSRPISTTRAGRAAARGVSRLASPRDARRAPSISWSSSISACSTRSATSSAWSRACRRRRKRWRAAAAPAATSRWLLVQILRHLGLAARFVSGYLIQLKPDVKPLDGPAGADARLHRPARLGRGLSAGRRLDRARSDLGPAVRARAICRSRRRRISARAAPITGAVEPAEVDVRASR